MTRAIAVPPLPVSSNPSKLDLRRPVRSVAVAIPYPTVYNCIHSNTRCNKLRPLNQRGTKRGRCAYALAAKSVAMASALSSDIPGLSGTMTRTIAPSLRRRRMLSSTV